MVPGQNVMFGAARERRIFGDMVTVVCGTMESRVPRAVNKLSTTYVPVSPNPTSNCYIEALHRHTVAIHVGLAAASRAKFA